MAYESSSSVEILNDKSESMVELRGLANEPIRDNNDFFLLEDIETPGKDVMLDKEVNLLFAIREVFDCAAFYV